MGKSSEDSPSSWEMRFSMLLDAFFVISWSSISSALATSDVEGISSSASSELQPVDLPLGISKLIFV